MFDTKHTFHATARTTVACIILALGLGLGLNPEAWGDGEVTTNARPAIIILNPPAQGFFSKQLDVHGIPIRANQA